MRLGRLILAAASVLPLVASAQVPSIKTGAAFQLPPPLNAWHMVMENHGSSSIQAFYASYDCPKGGPIYMFDALFHYGFDIAIPPAGSVEIGSGDPGRCSGGLKAAIFSDGHTEGSVEALNELYARRRGALTALNETIELLDAIGSKRESLQDAIDTVSSRSQSRRYVKISSDDMKGSEAVGYQFINYSVKQILSDSNGDFHFRSDHAGKRWPGVDDVMNTENISRDQARAMVIRKKLQEWQSALEGNLQPPAAN